MPRRSTKNPPIKPADAPEVYRRLRPNSPSLTVDAVWIHAGRVLLVRRGRPPFRGRWALPGGFVEGHETVEAAVARELLEETGLRARPRRLVGVYSGPGRDPRGPTVSLAYEMQGRAGPPTGGDDAAEARWVPVRPRPRLAFDHDRIVEDALGGRRSSRTAAR